MTRRILVTGSRTWDDYGTIRDALAFHGRPGDILVSGNARGADQLAERAWESTGGTVERHPANWDAHGKAAGILRNRLMVDLGADMCLAFQVGQSRGTEHCASLAEARGIETHRWRV